MNARRTVALRTSDAITPQMFPAPFTRRLWRPDGYVIGIKTKRPHDVTACVVFVMVEPSGDMTGMKAARFYPGNLDVGIIQVIL
jgi:hypothetical protein